MRFVTNSSLNFIVSWSRSFESLILTLWPFRGAEPESGRGSLDSSGRFMVIVLTCSGYNPRIWIAHITPVGVAPSCSKVLVCISLAWVVLSWAWSHARGFINFVVPSIWPHFKSGRETRLLADRVLNSMVLEHWIVVSWTRAHLS